MDASLVARAVEVDANDPERYTLVSGFYGPGAVLCWHLTHLSCVVAWTMHPRRRSSDSIDLDFLTVLTYSATAAGHLIVQAGRAPPLDAIQPLLFTRAFHGLEVSLSVVATSAALLIFPGFYLDFARVINDAARLRTLSRRQILRVLVCAWLLWSLCYLRIKVSAVCNGSTINGTPDGACWPLWDGIWVVAPLLYAAVGIAWRCGAFAGILTPSLRTGGLAVFPDILAPNEWRYMRKQPRLLQRAVLTVVCGILGLLAWMPTLSTGPTGFRWRLRPALLALPFQLTDSSILDLDQAAAAIAGATALGFSIADTLREVFREHHKQVYEEAMDNAILDDLLGAGKDIEHAPAKL